MAQTFFLFADGKYASALASLLLLLCAFGACSSPATDGAGLPNLLDATLEDLQGGLEKGAFTSVDLVNAYLARIKEVNPRLHAVAEINPDAVDIAAALDAEREEGKVRGPLHGIPILIKANIATKDNMNTSAGSFALIGAKVPRDSTVAAKLRTAGVILLGKANLSQWANWRSNGDVSSNGWSAVGGQVFGAYHPDQEPCGSSSGSGVSSSLGLAFASLGTETSGSIVCPSSFNNVVGIKPTVGLTSRSLVIPVSARMDTVGPLARTVRDAAVILSAIAGPDPHDNYTSAIPFDPLPDFAAACDPSALRGARLGVPINVLAHFESAKPAAAPVWAAFRDALDTMRSAGATIVDTSFDAFGELGDDLLRHMNDFDFKDDVAAYFAQLTHNPQGITSLEQLRTFTAAHPLEEYASRGTALWDSGLALPHNSTDYNAWAVHQQLHSLSQRTLLGALERDRLDAVVVPDDTRPRLYGSAAAAPLVTVPLGFYPEGTPLKWSPTGVLVAKGPNIPFGLTFMGARWSDEKLIGLAYAYEQISDTRKARKPWITPTIELRHVVGKKRKDGNMVDGDVYGNVYGDGSGDL